MAFLRSFTLPVNVGNVNHSFFDKSFCCYFVRLLVMLLDNLLHTKYFWFHKPFRCPKLCSMNLKLKISFPSSHSTIFIFKSTDLY